MVRRYFSKKIIINIVMMAVVAISITIYASSNGRTGTTLKNGNGCNCHGASSSSVTVVITGPNTLVANTQGSYTLTITGGPLVTGGCNIAASTGTLGIVTSDLKLSNTELTHSSPKASSSGSITFQFTYTAPATIGDQTLYADGLSADNTGGTNNDAWNNAANYTVSVTSVTPVELTSFTASINGSDVGLSWSTATEINNSGYKIDRMNLNNSEWKTIASIKGSGNSSKSHNYNYTDKNLTTGHYAYRLVQMDFNGTTTIYKLQEDVNISAPANFELSQNYPNPFNPATLIKYQIPENSNVNIKIYNTDGQEVAQVVNGDVPAGTHEVLFNAAHLSSGVYYYAIKAGNKFVQTKKMILLK